MYSRDLQLAALRIYNKTKSLRKTAETIGVCHMTVQRWIKSIERKQRTRRDDSKSSKIVELVTSLIESSPHATLKDIQNVVLQKKEISVSKESIRLILKKEKYSWKKIKYYGECKDLDSKTKLFIQQRDELINQGRSFVSIDETSFGRHGKIRYGYSIKGKPLYKRKAYPRVTTKTALCCLYQNGSMKYELHTGAVNSNIFLNFLQSLQLPPKSVILLDNCRFHHSKIVKEFALIHSLTLLYTPAYSPWFNPIESSFSLIKRDFYKNEKIENSLSKKNDVSNKNIFTKSLSCVQKI